MSNENTNIFVIEKVINQKYDDKCLFNIIFTISQSGEIGRYFHSSLCDYLVFNTNHENISGSIYYIVSEKDIIRDDPSSKSLNRLNFSVIGLITKSQPLKFNFRNIENTVFPIFTHETTEEEFKKNVIFNNYFISNKNGIEGPYKNNFAFEEFQSQAQLNPTYCDDNFKINFVNILPQDKKYNNFILPEDLQQTTHSNIKVLDIKVTVFFDKLLEKSNFNDNKKFLKVLETYKHHTVDIPYAISICKDVILPHILAIFDTSKLDHTTTIFHLKIKKIVEYFINELQSKISDPNTTSNTTTPKPTRPILTLKPKQEVKPIQDLLDFNSTADNNNKKSVSNNDTCNLLHEEIEDLTNKITNLESIIEEYDEKFHDISYTISEQDKVIQNQFQLINKLYNELGNLKNTL